MRRLIHWFAHRLGWNGGRVETWFTNDRRLMVGFRCSGCGKVSGIEEVDEEALMRGGSR